jgi:hypothetical protein
MEGPDKLKMVYTDIRTATGDEAKEMQNVIQKFGQLSMNIVSQRMTCARAINKFIH